MDIIQQCEKDHAGILELLKDIKNEPHSKQKADDCRYLRFLLKGHNTREDNTLYRCVGEKKMSRVNVELLKKQHEQISILTDDICNYSPIEAKWAPIFDKLYLLIQNHFELEQRQLFPYCHNVIPEIELIEMYEQVEREKKHRKTG